MADRLGGLKVARKVVQMADRLEDLKVARTEDRSVGRWAVLTADRLGGLKKARMEDRLEAQMEDRLEARTEDRSAGQWEGRMEAQTVDHLRDQREQMEAWPEGLAPRRQERVSAVLQARSLAPLASA